MKKLSLTQDWVSRMAAAESAQVPVIGADRGVPPSPAEVVAFIDDLARTETVREMTRRKWLEPGGQGTIVDRRAALVRYLARPNSLRPAAAMYRGRLSSKRPLVEAVALQAWLGHLADTARATPLGRRFVVSELTSKFLSFLVELSPDPEGPRKALDAVRELGIHVIVEGGLPGMSVDGASFHRQDTGPVIGLTLRHDRLDNFWFTLLHELGHIALHLNSPSDEVFVDAEEDDVAEFVEAEAEANAFAKDALIPRDTWLRSAVHRLGSEATVVALARQLRVHPAIVAGRIRYERRDFRIFNNLLGRDQVREIIYAAA